jgi:hypothetical protein
VLPVLGGEVEERQQHLQVVADLRDRLRVLRGVGRLERGDRVEGAAAMLGVPDLGQRLLRCGLGGGGQCGQDVDGLVEPSRNNSLL